jgi:putative sigma-54 modulation protein
MRLELTGRKVAISPGLRRLVDRKLAKLLRQLNDSGIAAAVIVSKHKFECVVELNMHVRGERFLHAVAKGETWEIAVSEAVEKVLHQAQKAKGKWQERTRRGEAARSAKRPRPARPVEEPPVMLPPKQKIVRASRYAVKPMTADEAAIELDGRDEQFPVFHDARTEAVTVLYRRKDGNLALIAPDA